MKFDIKNSAYFLKLLSILGYIYLFIHIIFILFIKPYIMHLTHPEYTDYEDILAINEIFLFYIFGTIITTEIILTIIVLLCAIIKQIINKKNITIKINHINNFWKIGLFLQLTPIVHILYIILKVVIYSLIR